MKAGRETPGFFLPCADGCVITDLAEIDYYVRRTTKTL